MYDLVHVTRGYTGCGEVRCYVNNVAPLPFFHSVATVAVAGENGNAGNVFPYT